MYLSPDEARSDVILTGAAVVFGGVLLSLLLTAPGVPTSGTAGELILLLGWFALSGLTPYLLARYRDDVPGAFGLAGGRRFDVGAAVALAAPAVVVGIVRGVLVGGSPAAAALGRPGQALFGAPAGDTTGGGVLSAVLEVLAVAVLTVGALLLVGFLVTRGRDAFRSDARSATELLRTFGAGAVGVALVFGTLGALTGGTSFASVLLNVAGVVALVAVADRLVPGRATVERAAVLTPVVLVLVAHVLAAGGIFRGDLVTGLTRGALAAGTTLVIAVLAEQRRTTALAIPLLVAVHWWPTCLSPLPFAGC